MKQSKPSSRPVAFPRKTDRFALSGRAVFRGQGLMRWLLACSKYSDSGLESVLVERVGCIPY
jgi:hypothetical protein